VSELAFIKYPRTRHIEGSRLQPGDEDLESVPFAELAGRPLVIEEKLDGANAAVSFDAGGGLRLQSRGHLLTGGRRERHFALLKAWATAHQGSLRARLGARYVVFGEWLYAKHTLFYDALPHYFMEFDVYDRDAGAFLSTPRRRELLAGLPLRSVPVLHEGPLRTRAALEALVTLSRYKTPAWRERLRATATELGLDPDRVGAETDPRDEGEGLYVKLEEGGVVTGRFKWVRASFLASVLDSGTHWLSRPIVPNGLGPGVDVFEHADRAATGSESAP
jgi:hypothetical protein